jgi:hypothetical protein
MPATAKWHPNSGSEKIENSLEGSFFLAAPTFAELYCCHLTDLHTSLKLHLLDYF